MTQPRPSSGFSPYHKRLFVFLSVATFFEGYDFTALSQILPNLRADMVGAAAGTIGWGSAVSLTAVFLAAALTLILWLLPETAGRELEETARL